MKCTTFFILVSAISLTACNLTQISARNAPLQIPTPTPSPLATDAPQLAMLQLGTLQGNTWDLVSTTDGEISAPGGSYYTFHFNQDFTGSVTQCDSQYCGSSGDNHFTYAFDSAHLTIAWGGWPLPAGGVEYSYDYTADRKLTLTDPATGNIYTLRVSPPASPFKSVTDVDWHLVSSTDPDVSSSLTDSTFLVWHFGATFDGTIRDVQNNLEENLPVKTFIWNPNAQLGLMTITFYARPTTDAQGKTVAGASEGTTYYQYVLGTGLTLYDTARGFTYQFVPYTAVH